MDKALCIDIGNTRSKIAKVENYIVSNVQYFNNNDALLQQVKICIQEHAINYVIVSSVKQTNDALMQLLQSCKHCIVLDSNTSLPFAIHYTTPQTLGKDRLALVAAAYNNYPKQHSLVISLGTCITYNFLQNGTSFVGGGIAPGLQMRFNALHTFTDKLPLVNNIANAPLVGTDTSSSIQSGVINGVVAELDGIIDAYIFKYKKINVVLTGGDMMQLRLLLKNKIFADAHFLFQGLYFILWHNTKY
jgi:type III pantothenate kinase